MNRQSKKRKGINYSKLRCPYCGSSVIYRSADGIYRDNPKHTMLYVCSRYPACDSYVRVHAGTKIPVGELANQPLRTLRRHAHHYYDQIYLSGLMSKQEAYVLGLPANSVRALASKARAYLRAQPDFCALREVELY